MARCSSALVVDSQIVEVEVGVSASSYYVHQTELREDSEFFEKALNHYWKESANNKIQLPDAKEHCFRLFVDWLYTKRSPGQGDPSFWLPDDIGHSERENLSAEEHHQRQILGRLDTLILADYLAAPNFLVVVNDDLVDYIHTFQIYPGDDIIARAFNNLPPHAAILELLVHSRQAFRSDNISQLLPQWEVEDWNWLPASMQAIEQSIPVLEQDLPLDYLSRTVRCLEEVVDAFGRPQLQDRCNYHEHVGDQPSESCSRSSSVDTLLESEYTSSTEACSDDASDDDSS
ncbi:hypothetical protein HBH53_262180 [Parastagonospora nodorum]|nr:hypothetical protein HBH53_262180 [Parastagonospora nodorum]KAH3956371.1 hypothetical protein HBH51_242970 [Parastagonospora nodorum]KAH4215549.1 hypothetical protein HBI06_247010 [Parastagonospora nodorum]KAH4222105.1 hypothetical protein HBI05_254700 [Parastagonospora nodorum]KAH4354522.1 hypothetical protein HBH97_247480 [Parastagonospora nodorum]